MSSIAIHRLSDRSAGVLVILFALVLPAAPGAIAQSTTRAETLWSSYFGGGQGDQVLAVATDDFGHIYIAGRTGGGLTLGNDTSGQSGATFQDTLGGGLTDAFLGKVAPHGSVLWLTYFGGEGDDEAVDILVDGMSGVYLVGNTTSTTAIATDSCAQDTAGGGRDAFLARFSEHGELLGATYIGGTGNETALGGTFDPWSRPMVYGRCDASLPMLDTLAQQPYTAGLDGFVLAMQDIHLPASGTYLGGSGDDEVKAMTAGGSAGQYALLNTTSPGLATPGAYMEQPGGGTDGALMKLDTNLVKVTCSYFGSLMDDHLSDMALHLDTLAICGTTTADTLFLDSLAYRTSNQGSSDGFVTLLDADLQPLRCTFIGGAEEDSLFAVRFDTGGDLYLSGTTRSPGLASGIVPDGSLSGPSDGFVLRMNTIDSVEWAGYFGGANEEVAATLCVIGHTSVLMGGSTSSTSAIAEAGHQMIYGGGADDGFMSRWDQETSTPCEGICTGSGGGGGGSGSGSGGSYSGVSPPLLQYDICLGESVTFIAYGGALGIGAAWMWYADGCGDPPHFLTSGDTITIQPTTSFTLSVRAESVNSVSACRHLPIVVHTYPNPYVDVTDTICVGSEALLMASGADSFTWSVGDSIIASGQSASWIPDSSGTQQVTLTATNGPACAVDVDSDVEVLPLPSSIWNVIGPSCHGSEDGLLIRDTTDIPVSLVAWVGPGIQGDTLAGTGTGTFHVTVTATNGCQRTDSILVEGPPALIDSVGTTPALCGLPNGTATAMIPVPMPGLLFNWGNGPTSQAQALDLPQGNYTLLVTDSTGCEEEYMFTIISLGAITALIVPDSIPAINGQTVLQGFCVPPDSLATYSWSPTYGLQDPGSPVTPCTSEGTTTYYLLVTSSDGCTSMDSVVVLSLPAPVDPLDPCGEAFLPTAFSPNGDGLNDELCPLGGCYTELSLVILDRWGGTLYASDSPENACWNGTRNGTPVPAGVYAFSFSATRSTGEEIDLTGTLELHR